MYSKFFVIDFYDFTEYYLNKINIQIRTTVSCLGYIYVSDIGKNNMISCGSKWKSSSR